jgi:putative tricarboxylic transport membrane protein
MIRFLGRQWITVLLFFCAGVYTLASLEYGIRVKPQPQSGFVPFLLGILILGLTGIVLVRMFWAREACEKEAGGENIPRKRFTVFLLLLLAGTACFEYLGFCFTSMAMIFLSAYLMGLRGWWKAILLAVLATLVADFLFAGLLGVPLPGILSSYLVGGN